MKDKRIKRQFLKSKRIFLFDWVLRKFIKENLVREEVVEPKSIFNSFLYGEEDCLAYYDADREDTEPVDSEGLDELINLLKKATFTEELIRLIRESGKKDSQIYKAADIDKRLFSKIMSDRDYKPSKDTAIALSLALRLSFEEMQDLISRAGYTITHSSKRDLIIEFFFKKKQYRLIELNAALYRFGEKTLGRTK